MCVCVWSIKSETLCLPQGTISSGLGLAYMGLINPKGRLGRDDIELDSSPMFKLNVFPLIGTPTLAFAIGSQCK